VVVPEKGWVLVEKGEDQKEGKRALGVWTNGEETIKVGAGWDGRLPDIRVLLGFGPEDQGTDPIAWPVGAELLEKPLRGLRIPSPVMNEETGERLVHYWIYGDDSD